VSLTIYSLTHSLLLDISVDTNTLSMLEVISWWLCKTTLHVTYLLYFFHLTQTSHSSVD